LDKLDRFRSTVGANCPAAIIIVPVGDDSIQVFHHGAIFARGLGFDPIVGSFRCCESCFCSPQTTKVDDAVRVIGAGANPATRPKTIETPDLDDYFGVEAKDDFVSLEPTEKNPNEGQAQPYVLDRTPHPQHTGMLPCHRSALS